MTARGSGYPSTGVISASTAPAVPSGPAPAAPGDTGRIPLTPSLWPTKGTPRRVCPFRWDWQVTDHSTGAVLASGWALTERGAWRREDRAARRIHAQREAEARP